MVIRRLTQNEIQQIRKRVLSGKTKNQVAKELGVSSFVVYSHTRDIPIKKDPKIQGRSLELLRKLLTDGYVFGSENGKRHNSLLRELQLLFPMIQSAHVDERTIFYLEEKKREALSALVRHRHSRIINYYDLMNVTRAFNIQLQTTEKRRLLDVKKHNPCPKIRLKEGGFCSSLLTSQQKLSFSYELEK